MGVHGLWKLLDASGKPVPLETLENKILAVDVSIWLHQVVKGFQDSQGNSLPNAHLLGLFHRVCKLLFYKIKPVFVFDGGVPHLKKQNVIARRQQKNKAELEADKLREQLLKNLVKHAAVKRVLGNSSRNIDLSALQQQKENDMFELPPQSKKSQDSLAGSDDEIESSDEERRTYKNWSTVDLHAIDVNSTHFKSLPAEVRHDILSELKETRKQSSWGRLHEIPKESSDFSSYQMTRLLKRRSVQVSLEDAEQEMGGRSLSLGELEEMLSEQGVVKNLDDGRRIASDSTTRYLYIKDIGNKILRTKSDMSSADESSSSQTKEESKPVEEVKSTERDVKEREEEEEDYYKDVLNFIPEEEQYVDVSSSSEEECSVERKVENNDDVNLKVAQNFIFENSGLTQQQILAVIQYQNVIENDTQQSGDNFFSPDQPSTSGVGDANKLRRESETVPAANLHDITQTEDSNNLERQANKSDSSRVVESSHVQSKGNNDTKEIEETNSDTDNDSFVEVTSSGVENTLQVVIQRDKQDELEDDIFADIFTEEMPQKPIPSTPPRSTFNAIETDIAKDEGSAANHVENIKDSRPVNGNIEEQETSGKEESTSDTKAESAVDDLAIVSKVSSEELQQLQASLQEERRDLMTEQGRQERLAANITDQMCVEAQELLQVFGVPYIVAPMEAEAQCAFLDLISLTDGTITDDSDIWLFGGQKVYKNFFNQKKHVLRFQASDIKHYFNLERQQLVTLALLVGSDYTPGLQGVGPVTALEILAAFPSSSEDVLAGLQKFRDWLNDGMTVGPGKTPLKNKLKNVKFTEGFPSSAVVDAYLNPKVDESKETFSWAFPDLESLREFTKRKFGWTRTKSDGILLPVMKKQEESKSQRSLDSYFKVVPQLSAADGKLSKRVQQAVQRIGRETTSDNEDTGSTQPKRKRTEPKNAKPKEARGRGKCVEHKDVVIPSTSTEFIPQRERDKINALKSKLRAIEVFRTSKIDKSIKKPKKTKRRVLKEAKLSESSSDSD